MKDILVVVSIIAACIFASWVSAVVIATWLIWQ